MRKKLTIVLYLLILSQLIFSQAKINLIGHLPFDGGVTDVWGYKDTLASRQYAIVGSFNSIRIIDVTIPEVPHLIKHLTDVPGFDFKTWKNYLYTVTGSQGFNEGMIIDINNPANASVVANFNSAHNIFISPNGYMFAEIPGLKIYNLNTNPISPVLIYDSKDQEGHDAALIRNRLYDFHGFSGTNIYEVEFGDSIRLNLLSRIQDPDIMYHHSGWVSEDGNTLFICDELAVNPYPDVTAWNISDPSNPVKVGGFIDTNATIHNLFVLGDYAYTSYYASGFRVLNISDPSEIVTAAEYDTNPASGDGFSGAFGVYHDISSGYTYISDGTGLYIFEFEESVTSVEENRMNTYELMQNYPNPFNPSTMIRYLLSESSHVLLKITSLTGEEIKVLVNEYQNRGIQNISWDGTGNNGEPVSQGVYFYSLITDKFSASRKMILLK